MIELEVRAFPSDCHIFVCSYSDVPCDIVVGANRTVGVGETQLLIDYIGSNEVKLCIRGVGGGNVPQIYGSPDPKMFVIYVNNIVVMVKMTNGWQTEELATSYAARFYADFSNNLLIVFFGNSLIAFSEQGISRRELADTRWTIQHVTGQKGLVEVHAESYVGAERICYKVLNAGGECLE